MASGYASRLSDKLSDARSRMESILGSKTDAWTDLGLTLPVFLGYHLGVVFLPVRNAADFVTSRLVHLANQSILAYTGLTLVLGSAVVGLLLFLRQREHLTWKRFAKVIGEGIVYAILMKLVANQVVGSLRLSTEHEYGFFSGAVMSLGAGFYEEVVFRVVLFGLGSLLLLRLTRKNPIAIGIVWALATSFLFSAWHYVGAFGDPFELRSFVFRWVCGLVFVAIYKFRGFAPVVWCHALYDVWVLAL